jgi:hypothetical protein
MWLSFFALVAAAAAVAVVVFKIEERIVERSSSREE